VYFAENNNKKKKNIYIYIYIYIYIIKDDRDKSVEFGIYILEIEKLCLGIFKKSYDKKLCITSDLKSILQLLNYSINVFIRDQNQI